MREQKAKTKSGFNIFHGPVHFSVLRLKRKNKHSIYFKTSFVSFRENGLFDVIRLTANI